MICDVFDTSVGSEMWDLLTVLFRLGGIRPWLWKPWDVGVLFPDGRSEGCDNAGVGLTAYGWTGDGLGDVTISN
jgi:hypothetical protein